MSKKGVKQAFKESQYNPTYLLTQDVKILRQDYTRLRDIMQKRLKRLEKGGFKNTSFQNWVSNIGGEIPKLATLKKEAASDPDQFKRELVYWLSELKTYENKQSTIPYQQKVKKERAQQLRAAGYDKITDDLFNDFVDFMQYISNVSAEFVLYTESTEQSEIGYNPETETKQAHVQQVFETWRKNDKKLPTELLLLRNL